MIQFSIRKLMLAIAVLAVLLGGFIETERSMERSFHGGCTRTSQCASNIRNVVLSVLVHAARQRAFPKGTWPNPDLPPGHRLSWYAAILPQLENQELYDSLDEDEPWYGVGNDEVAYTRIGVLNCPDSSTVGPGGLATTPYIGIGGLGLDSPWLPAGHPRAGVFGYDRRTTLVDIKDGTAYTMVIAESARVAGAWLAGGPATVRGLDPTEQPYLGPGRQFGGIHPGGVTNVAFADGSVRGFRDSIDPRLFEGLSTIAGGETRPSD